MAEGSAPRPVLHSACARPQSTPLSLPEPNIAQVFDREKVAKHELSRGSCLVVGGVKLAQLYPAPRCATMGTWTHPTRTQNGGRALTWRSISESPCRL